MVKSVTQKSIERKRKNSTTRKQREAQHHLTRSMKTFKLNDWQLARLDSPLMTDTIDIGFEGDCRADQFEQAQAQAKKFNCDVIYFSEEGSYGGDFKVQYFGGKGDLDRLLEEIGYDEESTGMTWQVVSYWAPFGAADASLGYELVK
jgi:hypothetical protein